MSEEQKVDQPVEQPVEPAAQAMSDIETKVTNETAAQAGSCDEGHDINEPKKKPKREMVRIMQKAIVEWTDKEGKVVETYESYRGLVPLAEDICIKAETDKYKDLNVHAYLKTMDDIEQRTFTIIKGTAQDAAQALANKVIDDPRRVLQQLQLVIQQLSEISELKGIIVTAVIGEAQAAGFGMINDAIEVTNEDIIMLGASAANQVDQFKDAMRQRKNVEFPGDSKIVLATQMPGRRP